MRIFVISPFWADTGVEQAENIRRAQNICYELVMAGHTPFAPHLHYSLFLDDDDPDQRRRGIECSHDIMLHGQFERAWYYPGRGVTPKEVVITSGMQSDMDAARSAGIKVERGTIGGDL